MQHTQTHTVFPFVAAMASWKNFATATAKRRIIEEDASHSGRLNNYLIITFY